MEVIWSKNLTPQQPPPNYPYSVREEAEDSKQKSRRRQWLEHKDKIVDLYITQSLRLERVREIIAKDGFVASKSEYKKKLKEWGRKKNIKLEDKHIRYIVRKFGERTNDFKDMKKPSSVRISGVREHSSKVSRIIKRRCKRAFDGASAVSGRSLDDVTVFTSTTNSKGLQIAPEVIEKFRSWKITQSEHDDEVLSGIEEAGPMVEAEGHYMMEVPEHFLYDRTMRPDLPVIPSTLPGGWDFESPGSIESNLRRLQAKSIEVDLEHTEPSGFWAEMLISFGFSAEESSNIAEALGSKAYPYIVAKCHGPYPEIDIIPISCSTPAIFMNLLMNWVNERAILNGPIDFSRSFVCRKPDGLDIPCDLVLELWY